MRVGNRSFYLSLGYYAAHHRCSDGNERQLSPGVKRDRGNGPIAVGKRQLVYALLALVLMAVMIKFDYHVSAA